MFCIKCGKKVDEDIKYCDKCNASNNNVKIEEESKQSINNNTSIDIGHKKEKRKERN